MKLIFSKQQRKPPLRSRGLLLKAIRRATRISSLTDAFRQADEADRALHVILVDRTRIRELNRRHLDRDTVTDVLAFDLRGATPFPGEAAVGAEIYVCLDVAVEAAGEYSTTVGHEVLLYMVHGMLHLAGEDDHGPKARRRMRRAEQRAMDLLQTEFRIGDIFGEHPCSPDAAEDCAGPQREVTT